MNILHLEASSGWGGQEIRILREAEGMRKRGHQVILGVTKGGGLVSRAREAGFVVYELNFRRSGWLVCLFRLLGIFRQHQIDLVNTHSSLDSWIGGISARIGGKAIVRTRHLSTPIKKGWNSKLVYGKLADFVVTTCASILPMICSQSGKSSNQCRSVATGVDPDLIRVQADEVENFRKSLGATASDFVVGTACFMRSWKGIDDFLKAADLLRGVSEIKWVIIGGGHAETYKRRAREMGLEQVVHFTGHLDRPFPALAGLDCFALLSTAHEGVSQAILQAAYLGRPLVATATGGLGEVCLDGITGIQVPPFSSDRVAKAILEIKNQPVLQETFGRNGKELVVKQFTLSQTIDHMEEIYQEIVGKRKNR